MNVRLAYHAAAIFLIVLGGTAAILVRVTKALVP